MESVIPWSGPLLCKDDNFFRAFHFLLAFLFFPITWGICFSFKSNSSALNLGHKCTV